jgi:hypothetical protein
LLGHSSWTKNVLPVGRSLLLFPSKSVELLLCFSKVGVFFVVKLLFFSSIVVGEYDESFDIGETTVFLFFDCCCLIFPFCLFGVVGNVLFDVREGAN